MRILIAADDPLLAEFLAAQLQEQQYSAQITENGKRAQQLACDQQFDLVLLDLGAAALNVLRAIRFRNADLPILILANTSIAGDCIRDLDAGADDYFVKPFSFSELLARIRAILRRGNSTARPFLQVQDLQLDRISHAVKRGNREIPLSPKEFTLLEFLMRNAGLPLSRAAIIEKVWTPNRETTTNVVDVYINYLRRKVDSGSDFSLIQTIRGVGYRLG
jgi:two-component system, OmpR family, copper resistance phosphate regulon response regulator CusR